MKQKVFGALRWLFAPEDYSPRARREPSRPGALEISIFGKGSAEGDEPPSPAPIHRPPTYLWPRWIFLRALGLIYFSAFYSLVFQIKGLIGPKGILPAGEYLQAVAAGLHGGRFLFAPTLLWLGSNDRALMLLCWVGVIASLLAIFNVWPRAALVVCALCFLSFVGAAQDFASYQSDGMLLEAGFIALFFAPAGFWPGLARANPPSRASRFLLQWEWFRIYFESGVVKLASGDPSWRHFTAMDDYYQNGPLPTWIGWYVQHFPHWFHAATTFLTLFMELAFVWLLFLPRRFRLICFCVVTPFQIGIILTANYAFLNYIVLALGFLLLDDQAIRWALPRRLRDLLELKSEHVALHAGTAPNWRERLSAARLTLAAIVLGFVFYATAVQLLWMFLPSLPLPHEPVSLLEPFRIADRYGLFAVMTHARYEIEFQGSNDGKTWLTYPFRYKPQDVRKAPGIYAPYQPRFEWNLWFASLGSWQDYRWVLWTEDRLLENEKDVLELFARNPFPNAPPREVRSQIYQYWFTDAKTKREQGSWWQRELLGEYAPPLERDADGKIVLLNDVPIANPPAP